MDFVEDQDKSVAGSRAPVFGAIFMCNRHTKKECLRRNLFGLPPAQANFVKKIKAGMVLFLFEYEERKLHGVFQASSDGALDIVPDAFMSSGKSIPAQVKVVRIWKCSPLSEHYFRDAIYDNYYTAQKFNLGLSENQVYELLCLFKTRRVWSPESQNLFATKRAKKRSPNSGTGRLSVSKDDRVIITDRIENKLGMGKGLVDYLGVSRSGQNPLGIFEKSNLKVNSASVEGRDGISSIEPRSVELPVPKPHGLDNLNMFSAKAHCLDTSTSPEDYIPLASEDHCEPNEDYIPLMLEHHREVSRSRKSVIPNSVEDYKVLSFPKVPTNTESYPDPSRATVHFSSHGSSGRENISSCSLYSSDGCSCWPDHHHPAISELRHGYHEPSNASSSLGNASFCEGLRQDNLSESANDDYGVQMRLHSDNHKYRPSVFSRLTMSKKTTDRNKDDSTKVDMSVNQLINALLCQSRKHWGQSKKKSEHHFQLQDGDCLKVKNPQMQLRVNALVREEQQVSDDIIVENIEVPISFKRRSETQKVQAKVGSYSEESEGSSVAFLSRKRRKLVRPSFCTGETHDKGIIDDEIVERKRKLASGNSSHDETVLSGNVSAQLVCPVPPGVYGGDKEKVKEISRTQDFKVKGEAIVQELVGTNNCSLYVEGSSQLAQTCCPGDKVDEGSGRALGEVVDTSIASQDARQKEAVIDVLVNSQNAAMTKEPPLEALSHGKAKEGSCKVVWEAVDKLESQVDGKTNGCL